MKITCFVGSRRKEFSNTYRVINRYLSVLKENSINFQSNIYFPEDLNLKACKGCSRCFSTNKCELDKLDKFNEIKEELLESDVIILATPVYAASISADMKLFIDRLAYWLHLMPLAGKIGVSVVTASNGYTIETNSYLTKIMESLGLCVVSNLLCTTDLPNMMESKVFNEDIILREAKELIKYCKGEKELYASEYQNYYFLNLKERYDFIGDINDSEVNYWRNNKLFNYDSFKDLLDSKKLSI